MSELLVEPGGGFVLPGNRWDLLADVTLLEAPTVTVVVPHYNDQAGLDRVLTALAVQHYPSDRIDVVVADDGSSRPPQLAAAAQLPVQLRTQQDLGFRAAAARNLGAAAATGQILVFLDADTVPEPNYLRQLVRLPALVPDALVTGRRRHADFDGWSLTAVRDWLTGGRAGPPELTEPDWLRAEHHRSGNLLRLHRDSYRFVISAVLACRRSLFEELGGFDAGMVGYGGEDWDFAHRALCAGALLAHVPTAVAWHAGPEWAERGTPAERTRQKAAETAALAQRIPSSAGAEATGPPDVILELDTGGADTEAVLGCLSSILAGPRTSVTRLTGPSAQRVKAGYFAADPRITLAHVDRRQYDRARLSVQLPGACELRPEFWSTVLGQLEVDGVGTVTIALPRGEIVATANRAARRAARWQHAFGDRDLVAELFGRLSLPAESVGIGTDP
jgi:GT2 family glycosyltransferase